MKFSWKIFFITFLIIITSFGVGGFLLINTVFTNTLNNRIDSAKKNNNYITTALSVYADNNQPTRHQELRTFRIISKPPRFIMLRAIQFNDQSGRSTVKVHDESADNPLFINFYWIFAEKKVPELTLMGCHLPAKSPGIF